MFELDINLVNEIIATNLEFDFVGSDSDVANDYYHQTTVEQRMELCALIDFNSNCDVLICMRKINVILSEMISNIQE